MFIAVIMGGERPKDQTNSMMREKQKLRKGPGLWCAPEIEKRTRAVVRATIQDRIFLTWGGGAVAR